MNWLNTAAILALAYLAVFLQGYIAVFREWLGVQPDLLPAIMVYCGLSASLATISLTAILSGLWFDSLSSNPLGVTVLPLFLVGLAVYSVRDVLLRDQVYARLLLGAAAGAGVPAASVLILLAGGYRPIIGWGSIWQWLVLAAAGAVLTPACFWLFDRVQAALAYRRTSETTFRPDREIKRGRA